MQEQAVQLSFPTLDASDIGGTTPKVEPPKLTTEQDLWAGLIADIDQFAVAKTIADYIEASPEAVQRQHLPLYLRAKVTIKQGQIAYAEANKAVENARKSSSSVLAAGLDRVVKKLDALIYDAVSKAEHYVPAILAGVFAIAIWMH